MIPKVALGPLIIVWFKYGDRAEHADRVLDLRLPDPADDGARPARGRARPARPGEERCAARAGRLFTKIQLPGALPYIFSGMKVAAILAVAGAIVGEFLGSDKGLGYLMLQVQVTLDTAAMFMAVLLITLIGMLLYGAVLLLETRLRRSRRAGVLTTACLSPSSTSPASPRPTARARRRTWRSRTRPSTSCRASWSRLVGPSGCGKSTLLKILAGLHPHDARHRDDRLGERCRSIRRATSAWCSSSRCC